MIRSKIISGQLLSGVEKDLNEFFEENSHIEIISVEFISYPKYQSSSFSVLIVYEDSPNRYYVATCSCNNDHYPKMTVTELDQTVITC